MNKYWNCKIVFTIFIFLFFVVFDAYSVNAECPEPKSCTLGQTYCTSNNILFICAETSSPPKWTQMGCDCATCGLGLECFPKSTFKCTKAADCSDGFVCTTDTCENGGTASAECKHENSGISCSETGTGTTTPPGTGTTTPPGTVPPPADIGSVAGVSCDNSRVFGCFGPGVANGQHDVGNFWVWNCTDFASGASVSNCQIEKAPTDLCSAADCSCPGFSFPPPPPFCGQTLSRTCTAESCGGQTCASIYGDGYGSTTVASTDAGFPVGVGLSYPIGSALDPVIYSSASEITLWKNAYNDSLADSLDLGVWDVNDVGNAINLDKSTTYWNADSVGISLLPGVLYHWQMLAKNCTCITSYPCEHSEWSDAGYFKINRPPIFTSLIIKNISGDIVLTESENRNQICQTNPNGGFKGSRQVTFEVDASDPDGDPLIYSLSWNDNNIPVPGGVGTITLPPSFNNSETKDFKVIVTDNHGASVTSYPRSFKIWNCNVPVSGTIYDGSARLTCPDTGFSKVADKNAINFTTLDFKPAGGTNLSMTIQQPDGTSYKSGSNSLTWGVNGYYPTFNNGAADGTADGMAWAFAKMRSQSSSSNTQLCGDWFLDTTDLDAYAANIGFTADFSGIVDQDPWWQAIDGGVVSNIQIKNRVPVTCDDCKISFNGLVSAPLIKNTGKDEPYFQSWFYGGVDGNANTDAKLADVNKNYSYFYTQYFVKNGIGTILTGNRNITDIGATGIYFIDGDLTINSDKTVANGNFLMIIVKGNINVGIGASQIDGILVANNNITASGLSGSQLVFNGSLFASNTINFSRGYTVKSTNNAVPAVKVNYNPELMFKLPGEVAQILSNWQWGN